MRFYILILWMIVSLSSFAQLADPLVFNEKTHDFGSVHADGGSVTTEFTFVNKSNRPIKIINVQPSCGCTTPEWTREPVEAGKSGVIKAIFDPRGKIGYFNKSINVTTDYNNNIISLAIKGNVETAKADAEEDNFEVLNGSLKTKVSTFNIGKIFINKENNFKTFDLLNAGKNVLTFIDVKTPPYIKVQMPQQLKAGEKGVLKIFYDVKVKNAYGFASDNIEIITNDNIGSNKSYSVFATIEEFFPSITPEILAKAPTLKIEAGDIRFGEMLESAILQREVIIINSGKSDLSIRAMQPNCTCLTAVADKNTLKPGEFSKIKFAFAPKGRPGIQNKSIAIYSNDPVNPIQRITLSGNVR